MLLSPMLWLCDLQDGSNRGYPYLFQPPAWLERQTRLVMALIIVGSTGIPCTVTAMSCLWKLSLLLTKLSCTVTSNARAEK